MISRIEGSGVSKRYGNKLALDDLSFVVRRGLETGFSARMAQVSP